MPLSEKDLERLNFLYNHLRTAKGADRLDDYTTEIKSALASYIAHKMLEDRLAQEKDPAVQKQLTDKLNDPNVIKTVENAPEFNIWFTGFNITDLHQICAAEKGPAEMMEDLAKTRKEIEGKDEFYIMTRIAARYGVSYKWRRGVFEYLQEHPDINLMTAENPMGITASRNALSTAVHCKLLEKGYKLEDILEPFKLYQEVQEIGREVGERFTRHSEEDKAWFAEVYKNGQAIIEDHLDKLEKELAGKPLSEMYTPENMKINLYSKFLMDASQEKDHFKEYYTNEKALIKELTTRQTKLQSLAIPITNFTKNIEDYYSGTEDKASSFFADATQYAFFTGKLREGLQRSPEAKATDIISDHDFLLGGAISSVMGSKTKFQNKVAKIIRTGDIGKNIKRLAEGELQKDVGFKVIEGKPIEEGGMPEIEMPGADEFINKEYDREEDRAIANFAKAPAAKANRLVTESLKALADITKMIKNEEGDGAIANPKAAVTRCLAEMMASAQAAAALGASKDPREIMNIDNSLKNPDFAAIFEKQPAFKQYIKEFTEAPNMTEKLEALIAGGREAVDAEAAKIGEINKQLEQKVLQDTGFTMLQ